MLHSPTMKKNIKTIGNTLQQINLFHLIGEMEKQQEIAYQPEHQENIAENKRKNMAHEAVAACKNEIEQHLQGFLANNPNAIYEDWIRHLHPDNITVDDRGIDRRFYAEDSDHRRMWNMYMMERGVDCVEHIVDSRHVLPISCTRIPPDADGTKKVAGRNTDVTATYSK